MNMHAPDLAAPIDCDLFGNVVTPRPSSRWTLWRRKQMATIAARAYELGRRRALRRAGELLLEIQPAPGANQNIRGDASPKVLTRKQAARDAGLSKRPPDTGAGTRSQAALDAFYPSRDEADALLDVARRLERLSISRIDPHAFFETRSELVHDLRRIAGKNG